VGGNIGIEDQLSFGESSMLEIGGRGKIDRRRLRQKKTVGGSGTKGTSTGPVRMMFRKNLRSRKLRGQRRENKSLEIDLFGTMRAVERGG